MPLELRVENGIVLRSREVLRCDSLPVGRLPSFEGGLAMVVRTSQETDIERRPQGASFRNGFSMTRPVDALTCAPMSAGKPSPDLGHVSGETVGERARVKLCDRGSLRDGLGEELAHKVGELYAALGSHCVEPGR